MGFLRCITFIRSDLYRHTGCYSFARLLRTYFGVPGFAFCVWFRIARYSRQQVILWPLHVFARICLRHIRYRFGICIPYDTDIGPGLYIGHFGGIFVSHEARIGSNCNINHDVTVGVKYGGEHAARRCLGAMCFWARDAGSSAVLRWVRTVLSGQTVWSHAPRQRLRCWGACLEGCCPAGGPATMLYTK